MPPSPRRRRTAPRWRSWTTYAPAARPAPLICMAAIPRPWPGLCDTGTDEAPSNRYREWVGVRLAIAKGCGAAPKKSVRNLSIRRPQLATSLGATREYEPACILEHSGPSACSSHTLSRLMASTSAHMCPFPIGLCAAVHDAAATQSALVGSYERHHGNAPPAGLLRVEVLDKAPDPRIPGWMRHWGTIA